MIGGWTPAFEDFSIEVLELIDADDRVVMPMLARGRPHGSEQTVEVPETQVYTVHGDKIVDVREYRTKAEAMEAVGLSE